jgi:hypothetical protein
MRRSFATTSKLVHPAGLSTRRKPEGVCSAEGFIMDEEYLPLEKEQGGPAGILAQPL